MVTSFGSWIELSHDFEDLSHNDRGDDKPSNPSGFSAEKSTIHAFCCLMRAITSTSTTEQSSGSIFTEQIYVPSGESHPAQYPFSKQGDFTP
mmetsp:Transcript_27527/g.57454  ORF Transcript_27527/g.57454 Transcript_27527/m.57454 type:complete len:92 (+) Transcript_27527:132-407(+)